LEIIELSFSQISDVGTQNILQNCKNLRTLKLSWCPNITANVLKGSKNFPKLTELDLSQTQINDDTLKDIKNFPKLQKLLLNNTKINGAELKTIFQNCSKLEVLDLDDTPITYDDLQGIGNCQNLENISLSATEITDKALQHLKNFPKLCFLNLNKNITDAALEQFKQTCRKPNAFITRL
jgi:Leucine-rich repeat (LRR) protein